MLNEEESMLNYSVRNFQLAFLVVIFFILQLNILLK